MGRERNVRGGNQSRWTEQQLRRAALRRIVEENYGVEISRQGILDILTEIGHGCAYDTLARDMRDMGIEQVEAVLNGEKLTFYAAVGHTHEHSPEYLREGIPRDVLETEAYKELIRCVISVFTDDRNVVLQTTYEKGKSLALWLKNLDWPEIWYFLKDDGSNVIIRCRTPEQADFLSRRLMGFGTDALRDGRYSEWHMKQREEQDDST